MVRMKWRIEQDGWRKVFLSQESCFRFIHGPDGRNRLHPGLVQIFRSNELDDEGQRIWVLHMNIDNH